MERFFSPPRVADGAPVASEGAAASSIKSGLTVMGHPLGGEESAGALIADLRVRNLRHRKYGKAGPTGKGSAADDDHPSRRPPGNRSRLRGHRDGPPILFSSDSAVRTGSPSCASGWRYPQVPPRAPRDPPPSSARNTARSRTCEQC
ncbi:hypothetical protein GCM10010336_60120 [Streptomyces goshikiensis]|nr:hypothetical protein GCM10010336_60120 [Streptomyces goshikiensis]